MSLWYWGHSEKTEGYTIFQIMIEIVCTIVELNCHSKVNNYSKLSLLSINYVDFEQNRKRIFNFSV